MARFTRQSRVDADLETVWRFHSRIDGLEALTPGWAGLRVESLEVPGGGEILEAGTEMTLSVGPIPGGPRVRFVSEIVSRERTAGEAVFVDEMRDGPFESWRHTHRFVATNGGTLLRDEIDFGTGYGSTVDTALKPGFALAFAGRHRKTREMLGRA
ncbi:MAG: SRPBCC family protein [Halodesulfurarchaeum sp.]|nr:SRPBCC family protein [Halodesulfurarchaeum sp.]